MMGKNKKNGAKGKMGPSTSKDAEPKSTQMDTLGNMEQRKNAVVVDLNKEIVEDVEVCRESSEENQTQGERKDGEAELFKAHKVTDKLPEPTRGAGTKSSWAGLFKDNRAPSKGLKLRYIEPEGDFVDLSDGTLCDLISIWGYCLVGCFTGDFPGMRAIHNLMESWGVRCKLLPHKKGWVIFQFKSEEDRTKVLMGGPYMVLGRSLMLKNLQQGFSFEDEEFLKVPIWLKLPHLPMDCWSEDSVSKISSRLGMPIFTDGVTSEKTMLNYARVLVEVDVSKPPPLFVDIKLPNGRKRRQFVIYETFPDYCFHCKKYGHHAFTCKVLHQLEREKEIGEDHAITSVQVIDDQPQEAMSIAKCPIKKRGEIIEEEAKSAGIQTTQEGGNTQKEIGHTSAKTAPLSKLVGETRNTDAKVVENGPEKLKRAGTVPNEGGTLANNNRAVPVKKIIDGSTTNKANSSGVTKLGPNGSMPEAHRNIKLDKGVNGSYTASTSIK
ncbi:unnamed protein product [Cuscuta epithymum]|uniref:DUF4283 domain-containing protein n=1 Tax=Cuscuta epithymum TaxID=186058 RepID=A0AAV0CKK1_9ASTE|nr:unnamed protein product [Cuscuta epithymum]